MKKIGIFIDHDIMIRHFIRSGVLNELSNKYDVHYIFPKDYPKRVNTDVSSLSLHNVHNVEVDEHRTYLVKRFYQLTVMKGIRKRKGTDRAVILSMYKKMLSHRLLHFGPTLFTLDWIKSSWFIYPFFKLYKKYQLGENKPIKSIIQELNLDVIIHPTVLEGLFVNDLISLGKKFNIPTIFLMNSWDNPSCKAIMFGQPDKLFIWGEQTKQHAIDFLGCSEESLVCSGAAQFEIYKKKPLIDKNNYKSKLGIGNDNKLICYAGSSKGLNEMRHLQMLDEAIKNYSGKLKILYRPHPWKDIHKDERPFSDYKFKHIIIDPFSEENYLALINGDTFKTELMNYEYTNIVIQSIDAMISPLSTILLEAAMFGIPISVYLAEDEVANSPHIQIASQRTQFTEFYEIINPIICNSIDDLWPTIQQLLKLSNDREFCNNLKAKTNYFIEPSEKSYTDILFDTIENLI